MKLMSLFHSIYAGLHLKQARKPADSASFVLEKLIAFSRKGFRDLQLGLQ